MSAYCVFNDAFYILVSLELMADMDFEVFKIKIGYRSCFLAIASLVTLSFTTTAAS